MASKSIEPVHQKSPESKIASIEMKLWLRPESVLLPELIEQQHLHYGINNRNVCIYCANLIIDGMKAHNEKNVSQEIEIAEVYFSTLKNEVPALSRINNKEVAKAEVGWWHAHDDVSNLIFSIPERKNDISFFSGIRDSAEVATLYTSIRNYYVKLLGLSAQDQLIFELASSKTTALLYYSKIKYFQHDPLYSQAMRKRDEFYVEASLEENARLLRQVLTTAEN